MGAGLKKQFFSFRSLGSPEQLNDRKRRALELEKKVLKGRSESSKHRSGVLGVAKLVVASAKNFAHRIYLGRGICGDLQLRYCQRGFVENEWSYPDYKSEPILQFLEKIRKTYFKQLKKLS